MNDWMLMEVISVGGGVGLHKQVKTMAGHGKRNRIQYVLSGERRKYEGQKGTHWIGGSK
jgi:hypothetical protein